MKVKRINKSIVIQQNVPQQFVNNLQHKIDLKNIIELTQQNEGNSISQSKTSSKQSQKSIKNSLGVAKKIKSYINCVKNLWKYICYTSGSLELNINSKEYDNIIKDIKKKKKHYNVVLPLQKQQKKILVLDLDETLIHTTFVKPQKFDFEQQISFNGKATKIYTSKRFGLQSFLYQMSKLYQIVIFTASQKVYADKIINRIDPKNRISHRLYRQHCILLNHSNYLKNLNILGRNLKQTVIIDDNKVAGILQPDNFYHIEPFQGSEKDRQLCRLSAFLKHIATKKQFLPVREQRKQFQEMEIYLEEVVITQVKQKMTEIRSSNQRQRQYGHKKKDSEVQSLVIETETENEAETTASDLIKKL